MAYCSNCGAYIPDGEKSCVACGCRIDAAAAAQTQQSIKNDGSAPTSDELRKQMEEKQKQQQEKSREWAEKAYSEYRTNAAHSTSESTGSVPYSAKQADSGSRKTLGKVLSVMSYISIFCLLPFIITPEDKFARFHAKQGLLLFILSLLIDIVGKMFGILGLALSLFRLYLIYNGIKNVLSEKMEPLPYIGQYAEKF